MQKVGIAQRVAEDLQMVGFVSLKMSTRVKLERERRGASELSIYRRFSVEDFLLLGREGGRVERRRDFNERMNGRNLGEILSTITFSSLSPERVGRIFGMNE